MTYYNDRIFDFLTDGRQYTTQEITENIFRCKKGDAIYNNHVEDVAKDLQKMKKAGIVTFEKMDTGHGYQINLWRLAR